ncbi:fumarase, class I alpha subunit [Hathewaya proteolytica DSM 3090]|uniref:Fumarase, class I alpha subunit n=1 Tax=Hathewaya proteolytica DSM 3090 TaxID=1121331 RepID=A0A1M6PXE8_9CLOT|nr:fumarate hydratase [Hathewaya proteolytica]SHK12600.1 fumarase, class I alpha subunit [Hathewaya proteolytica DSM 3090]
MREINAAEITKTVRKLCIDANYYLTDDVKNKIETYRDNEKWDTAKGILDKIIINYNIAKDEDRPICQDTGMACVFIDMGQDVHVVGGSIEDAINEGVAQGYTDGYLRKSVVNDPIQRVNTKNNTPAVIYYNIVPGDKFKITVAPKGFGSENMSQLKMLKPADGLDGVKEFILKVVKDAGPNPCPPIVVGVGLGGTFDRAANLAKKALLRNFEEKNPDPFYADLEAEMLEKVNALGIGPQGFGGKTTALAVHIEHYPTHIAGLPVAVNINCHVARHASAEL